MAGAEIVNWQERSWVDLPARVDINGETVGETTAAALPGGPIGALEFILRLMQERGLRFKLATIFRPALLQGSIRPKSATAARSASGAGAR